MCLVGAWENALSLMSGTPHPPYGTDCPEHHPTQIYPELSRILKLDFDTMTPDNIRDRRRLFMQVNAASLMTATLKIARKPENAWIFKITEGVISGRDRGAVFYNRNVEAGQGGIRNWALVFCRG